MTTILSVNDRRASSAWQASGTRNSRTQLNFLFAPTSIFQSRNLPLSVVWDIAHVDSTRDRNGLLKKSNRCQKLDLTRNRGRLARLRSNYRRFEMPAQVNERFDQRTG